MNRGPVVRFAPSPTGPLHIGALRAALFNYLFAKGKGGRFLLRIEDTDQKRYVDGAVDHIKDSLAWLGISPDEELPSQAEFQSLHLAQAHRLRDEGKAYYAFDTVEELESMRARLKDQGTEAQHYNALSRQSMKNETTLSASEVKERLHLGEQPVLRFKVPLKQSITATDEIRGHIHLHSSLIEDKILVKSDGMPTYHLAHIVDDHRFGVTHVIRGEEWLPSLPFHLLLYEALGWKAPYFAHLSLLLKPEGKGKLSKRDADQGDFPIYAIRWGDRPGFREEGFLAEALFNFLACLGWSSPQGEEVLSRDALIEQFSLDRVSKAGVRFNTQKAKWYNQQYLHQLSPESLCRELRALYADLCKEMSDQELLQTVQLMQPRATLLPDILSESSFLRHAPTYPQPYPEAVQAQLPLLKAYVEEVSSKLPPAPESLKETYLSLAQKHGISVGKAFAALRYALSASLKGPDLSQILHLLGSTEVLHRLHSFLSALPQDSQKK